MDYWKDGLRILCVRLDNLGDVLMTTPAFRALKTTWPTCQLTLLTSSIGAVIAEYVSEIDHILPFDVPWVAGKTMEHELVYALVEQLKTYSFDAAILFTVQSQNPLPTAMLCYMAGIPRVLGYCRENPYQLLTDWVPDPEVLVATRHEVMRQLDLVKTVGCQTTDQRLSLRVDPADRRYARQLAVANGLDPHRPWFILHPGVSEPKRRYPAEHYIRAAAQLIENDDYQIILTGSQSEYALNEQIGQPLGGNAINMAGQLTLGQLAGLISEAPLLVANNTGPVHMAAAVGTPVVVLYAKTNPQHTPWQVPARVLYFDVPQPLRSRNVLLQQFPEPAGLTASPETLIEAVHELMAPWPSIA